MTCADVIPFPTRESACRDLADGVEALEKNVAALVAVSWAEPMARSASDMALLVLNIAWRAIELKDSMAIADLARTIASVRASLEKIEAALHDWKESVSDGG